MERTREGFRGFSDCLPGARDVGEPCRRAGGWSMTIAEVSKKCGLSADTLRYYERIGLIPPVPHSKSGIRDYDEASCGWIEWMKSITRALPKGVNKGRDLCGQVPAALQFGVCPGAPKSQTRRSRC